jgi:hypothetical protein
VVQQASATVGEQATVGEPIHAVVLLATPLVRAHARPESLVWKIPVGFVTGFGVASSDQVRLRLEDADSAGHYVEAGPFTVVGVGRR